MSYYLLLIIISSVSWVVSSTLKRKFKKYSRTSLRNGMSGSEIAEKMLFDHGITNVKVVCVKGKLTDHYNPKDRTVNLSESVFNNVMLLLLLLLLMNAVTQYSMQKLTAGYSLDRPWSLSLV